MPIGLGDYGHLIAFSFKETADDSSTKRRMVDISVT